ncbi:MAG: TIR domain-containing protein [Oscillospiraceae bacterium]|jgi:WD40 repeat protein|nr:TIR domain-containing protein [Oscillospiraceae bacterium]
MEEMSGAGYDAFISYRHKEPDSAVAKAVHRRLETFRVPAYIARRSGKKRIGKVFRDQDELPLMPDLGEGIRRALEKSEWLVVVCSPDLPESKWCMAEIDYFIELGGRERILTVLASGEPAESFPAQLRFVEIDGKTVEREPLAADVRADSVAASLKKLRREKLRLLAPMLGVGFDDLRRRARERFLRLLAAGSLAAAVFFAGFGGVTLYQSATISRQNGELEQRNTVITRQNDDLERRGEVITRQNNDLEEQRSKIYAGFSREQLDGGNRAGAALLALESLPEAQDDAVAITNEAKSALYDAAYRTYGDFWPAMQVPSGAEIVLSPDGKTFTASDAGDTRVYDAETFRLIYEHPGALTAVTAFESGGITGAEVRRPVYNASGDAVFLPNGEPVFVNVRTGAIIKEGYFTGADELAEFGLCRYDVVLPGSHDQRGVIDLETGLELFSPITEHGTSKSLFSPDGKYYVIATYAGLWVYDIEKRETVGELPCDGLYVVSGYTFFSPDSRFAVLTREVTEHVVVSGHEESRTVYAVQILEIPTCRIVYENSFPGYPTAPGVVPSQSLPNFANGFHSEIPAYLYARDGSRLILPVDTQKFGVYDLRREEMLFTKSAPLSFATFAPSGNAILTISQSGNSVKLLDAETGEELAGMYDGAAVYTRGFILPGDGAALLLKNGFCGVYELRASESDEGGGISLYFPDGSGRYVQPASGGKNAVIHDGRGAAPPVELEDSGNFTSAERFTGSGSVAVGLSDTGFAPYLAVWDAATGKKLHAEFPDPEHCTIEYSNFARAQKKPPFSLSDDGKRLGVVYQTAGVVSGAFRTFDALTGKILAEGELGASDSSQMEFDGGVTRLLFIQNNTVSVFDALTGKTLFTLDDYPQGQQALASWSGQKAALSGDGTLLAVSHSKKGTLELIDASTGRRLYEIPLGAQATAAPCFSRDSGRVAIGAGRNLISLDTATGRILFSFYDETGFNSDYAYSEDGAYLIGSDIRDAETGELVSPVALEAVPEWELGGGAGVIIPTGRAHAVYLPTPDEAAAELRAHVREYEFTKQDKLRFALD